jgi:hypothetical protein
LVVPLGDRWKTQRAGVRRCQYGNIVQKRHQKKDVEYLLAYARRNGFVTEEIHKGHRWGQILCPVCGPIMPIASTPRSPSGHAKDLRRRVDRCLAQHGRPDQPENTEEDTDEDS